MAEIGAGFTNPFDNATEFTALKKIIRQFIRELDTMKLVEVVAVTGGGGAIAKAGTVDVKPLVSMVDGDGNAQEHGIVYGIPWARIQGGTSALIIDPKVGDVGYVVVADRDSSAVTGAGAVTPTSRRAYNIADGVYVGGLHNDVPDQYITFTDEGLEIKDANDNKVELTSDGITVTDTSGNVIETSATGIKLISAGSLPVTVQGVLAVTGDLQIGGDITGSGGGTMTADLKTNGDVIAHFSGSSVGLATHTHAQGNDSDGDVEAETDAPTGGT